MIALPVLLVSAIAIKLSDGGPMLYRQTRIGEKGREIELLKLRTMDPIRRPMPPPTTGREGTG